MFLYVLTNTAGSTLEAMALAVERSAVVLVCLSQGYKDSPSCRTGDLCTMWLYKMFCSFCFVGYTLTITKSETSVYALCEKFCKLCYCSLSIFSRLHL